MREKRKDAAYAVLCTVVYMIILGLAVPFVYGIVDDRSMMEIVSGQYLGVPEAHSLKQQKAEGIPVHCRLQPVHPCQIQR